MTLINYILNGSQKSCLWLAGWPINPFQWRVIYRVTQSIITDMGCDTHLERALKKYIYRVSIYGAHSHRGSEFVSWIMNFNFIKTRSCRFATCNSINLIWHALFKNSICSLKYLRPLRMNCILAPATNTHQPPPRQPPPPPPKRPQ